ncbi:type III pantothenate kinase [Helicobacter cinaedi PAGU611]|uniref:Type III pantothenate kinase n=1 Tax=Helicobacter cinaedi CCUG 18818 = ATCC BAA-847 TaxID=537971 RepID=A0AAI8MMT1_9HELI|nr:type III pantothenate kinase [Helicobacter cinaedi]EFR47042.1 pantothenate kinase [Helicobacter cinaedi CCUG 18818 = ATCC BAA-847]QOQ91476.1 type III pantothenate kinase [Helicobacter cinaedi]BAM11990.1 type III pantothenate kinase [Helicobacter cinaedi PAGU611]BAM32499.1 type III pantothenate kinase [Helicobacter cinaedi CCUG 18818 = ATCC BAA-847]BBB19597.1 pantothenate kinase type III, CoaX-like [Helicobacter cinaedi]
MLLCDVGNTFLHFYHNGKIWKEKPYALSKKKENLPIYYISVNERFERCLLASHPYCVNIGEYIEIESEYKGLGVDRRAACKAVQDGVIIDAGSAITADIMQNGIHLGGYIMPGLGAYRKMCADISPVLDIKIEPSVNLSALPQNTSDALSFGAIKSVILMIKNTTRTKKIFFTGGDGKFFARFFENAIYDNTLVFKGMQKALQKHI